MPAVKITGLSRKVEVQRNEGAWEPADASMTLKEGDRIHTGWKAGVTLTFPDGSTAVLKPMSMVVIEKNKSGPDGTTVWLVLRLGEVAAQIKRVRGNPADFQVKTPTSVARSAERSSRCATTARRRSSRSSRGRWP